MGTGIIMKLNHHIFTGQIGATATRWILLAGLAVVLALPAGAVAAQAGSTKVDPKANASAPASGPEAQLKADMPADAVEKIMGKPAEVRSMASPDGHAEIWVYRRLTDHRVERVQVGSIPITDTKIGADGKSYTVVLGENIQYADAHIDTEVTVELLMFNGRYVTAKSSRREVRHYN